MRLRFAHDVASALASLMLLLDAISGGSGNAGNQPAENGGAIIRTAAAASEADAQPAAADQTAAAEAAPPAATLDDIDRLVVRIALYPDPLVALMLQASTAPLDVVDAARFVEKRGNDSTLQPDPDWDSSVIGLLNYTSVLTMMSDDLDWTRALGDAVLNQLEDVQAAIQQVRSELYAAGALSSNERQTVHVDQDVIRIEPVDPEVIYVPLYDVDSLAAYLDAPSPAPPDSSTPQPTEPAAGSAAATATPSPSAETPVGPAPYAPASPAPTVAEPAPVVYAQPPPVTYSDPAPSFWSTAATFAGGAVVGGLLGYAISDDDDDDDDDDDWDEDGDDWEVDLDDVDNDIDLDNLGDNDYRRRDVNIEDSNVIVAPGDRTSTDRRNAQIQSTLKERGGVNAKTARGGRDRAGAAAPVAADKLNRSAPPAGVAVGNRERVSAAPSPSRSVRPARAAEPKVAARPGQERASGGSGGLGDVRPAKEVRKEAQRGAQSRAVAQARTASARSARMPVRAAGQHINRPNRSSGSAFAQAGRGDRGRHVSDRGARSRTARGGRNR